MVKNKDPILFHLQQFDNHVDVDFYVNGGVLYMQVEYCGS